MPLFLQCKCGEPIVQQPDATKAECRVCKTVYYAAPTMISADGWAAKRITGEEATELAKALVRRGEDGTGVQCTGGQNEST